MTRVVGVVLLLLVAGCGSSAAEEEAASVASRFQTAVQSGDLTEACALLSPEARSSFDQRCEAALQEAGLPRVSGQPTAEVHGRNGLVRWSGETVFVSRFPGGWRVIAAGCVPRDARPYDCSVSGG